MSKYASELHFLQNIANKSLMTSKHAACVIKSGKYITNGFNTICGNDSHHAECDAIRNYLRINNIWLSNKEIIFLEKQRCFL